MNILAKLLIGVVAATGLYVMAEPPKHDDVLGKPSLVITNAEKELKHTRMVPVFETEHRPGEGLLWCSTFQLAWNELGELVNGKPGPVPLGGKCVMADQLNASNTSKADLDPQSYVAMAGLGKSGILDRIKAALAKNFGGAASPKLLPTDVGSDEILAYAYLFKNLEFENPFIRAKSPVAWGDTKLKAFGLWDQDGLKEWDKLASQVAVLDYQSPTAWAVELKSKATEDRLIVARLVPGETLAKTVEAALKMKAAEPPSFDKADVLKVPLMNYDLTAKYRDLEGKSLAPGKDSPVGGGVIKYAIQNIRLRLDERGAVLKSEAAIGVTSAPVRQKQPKYMVCDGPFLLLMIRKDAERPYFAMWAADPELLERW